MLFSISARFYSYSVSSIQYINWMRHLIQWSICHNFESVGFFADDIEHYEELGMINVLQKIIDVCVCVCVCVLTSLRGQTVWPNYEVVEFQASVSYCLTHRLCRLLLCIFPSPDIFPNPDISTTQVTPPTWASPISVPVSPTATRGNFPTGASLVYVPAYQPTTPSSSPFWLRYYYTPIYPLILLLLLSSREYSRVVRSCFSVASWRHQAFILRPPPLYPVSLYKPEIRDVAPPTAPQLPDVALCIS